MTVVLDPRRPQVGVTVPATARPADLRSRRVLLFDNGKLGPGYGARRALFDVLIDHLVREAPQVRIIERSDDLLAMGLAAVDAIAGEIASTGVDGVVLALVDGGVGMSTILLAIELERRGIPTCTLCEGPGLTMAAAGASDVAPFLPLVHLPILQGLDEPQVRQHAHDLCGDIVAALTGRATLRAGDVDVRLPPRQSQGGELEVVGDDVSIAFTAMMAADGLGDGFPLVAPTAARVAALLDALPVDPDDVVWPVQALRGAEVLVRDVAVVAAMAGARPEWMPIILTAYRNMAAPEFRLFQAAITVHPGGTLVLVSGPAASEVGIASGPGCLGPGYPANAAIGRAVALSYSFLLGSLPGGTDLSIQGSPAEYAYCCAEDATSSPWPGRNEVHATPDETIVTVLRCEGPKNVVDQLSQTPESLLAGIASACTATYSNNAYLPGQCVVFLNPAHARLLADAGWDRGDVTSHLYEQARNPRAALQGRGVVPIWPDHFAGLDPVPVATGPDDFIVTVAGAPGMTSQVAMPWGLSRAVTGVVGGGPIQQQ